VAELVGERGRLPRGPPPVPERVGRRRQPPVRTLEPPIASIVLPSVGRLYPAGSTGCSRSHRPATDRGDALPRPRRSSARS
jgi:hypothetical protein